MTETTTHDQERAALVTGATSGIGQAVAFALADQGFEVIVHGRDIVRGAETVKAIEARGGRARFVAADLSESGAAAALAAAAGPVDVLINNAGSPGSDRPTSSMRPPSTGCSPPTSAAPISWSRPWRPAWPSGVTAVSSASTAWPATSDCRELRPTAPRRRR